MKTIIVSAVAAACLGLLALATPAHAIPRTFVSATGSGTMCTRAAPCASFATAQAATDPGGEIDCLDAGVYPAATITKSITIDCTGTIGATASGFQVTAASAVVRLRGLTIRSTNNFGSGIEVLGGPTTLFVENCTITSDTGSLGIGFFPTSGTGRLYVSDSVISNNTSTGIVIEPSASVSVRAVIDHVDLRRNGQNGIDARANGAVTIVHLRDSVVSGNAINGITQNTAGGGTMSMTVDRVSSTLNGSGGVAAFGAPSFVVLGRSTVMSNVNGLLHSSGGGILSYQNNHLTGNSTDGTTTGMLSEQ